MHDPFAIYQNIHFIGIGGIGISALAKILHRLGHQVSGSDQTRSHNVDLLLEEGIGVTIGHGPESIPAVTDLVIYTTAIGENNSELAAVISQKIPRLTYPQAIGKISGLHRTVSICGTHGKTTTTALLGHIFKANGLSPNVIVGSLVKDFEGKNYLCGQSDLLFLESCEYQKAFLNYFPATILLNNMDPEHLDFYGTPSQYFQAFHDFIQKLPTTGTLIANIDDQNVANLIKNNRFSPRLVTFGRSSSSDFRLQGHTVHLADGNSIGITPSIPGEHNLLNATGAIATAHSLGLAVQKTVTAIASFQGASRRLEEKGRLGMTKILDDYGHAPAEISATLAAVKSKYGPSTKILCVFQPHQYSRTRLLFEEFCHSFGDAESVYIPNIYRSRDSDEDLKKISVDNLVSGINNLSPGKASNTIDLELTAEQILATHDNFDVIITMGAGDITRLSDKLPLIKEKG